MDNHPTDTRENVRILVADDDDALRRLMVNVLRNDGYSVRSASGGREAVEIVARGNIAVGLVDVKMPDVSGIEVLREAKRIDAEIEVILITGYADTDMAVEAVRCRAYDFIRKPFEDIRQISAVVRRALEKRSMARENARLTSEVQRQNHVLRENLIELTMLYELSNGIAHLLNYERLSEHLLERFLSLTSVEGCSSLLVRQTPPVLVVQSKREMSESALEAVKERALSVAREAAGVDLSAESTVVRYRRWQSEEGGDENIPAPQVSAERNEAVIVDDELVGILSMFLFGAQKFSPGDARLFSLLARQASQAMGGVRQALQAEKSRMSAMIESMAEGIVMLGSSGEIVVLNPAAKEMLGLNGNRQNLCQHLQELGLWHGSSGIVKDRRWEGRLLPDSEKIVQAEISDVKTSEGEWIGDVLVLRDVTKERESDRLKAEFVSTVSHELRTPLTGIKYVTSNLIKGVAGEISPKQKRYLEMAEESADRLRRLIEDLLCASKIEAGKLSLQKTETDLRRVAERVVATFEPVARGKSAVLEACFPSAEVGVNADEMRLEQILNNLVENAVKFTPAGGRITIEVADEGQVIEVSVTDTGRGIPEADRQKVFERFYQAGREEGAGAKGTGLGLAIVRQLVEMHDGRIWVESAEGEGSRFAFTLPKKATDEHSENLSPIHGCELAEESSADAKSSGCRR